MSAAPLAVDALRRLCERIVRGEVVFFVGAGFSIDNEGNTTGRLLGRLLVRFEAWTSLLQERTSLPVGLNPEAVEHTQRTAQSLRASLRTTFDLEESSSSNAPFLTPPNNQTKLNQVYYQFNDWICSAFADLLELTSEPGNWQDFLDVLNLRENQLRESHRANDKVSLERIGLETLNRLSWQRDRAKALFLQTLGFGRPASATPSEAALWAGDPIQADHERLRNSYAGKLLPRQHVLARLAREGLLPTLVTTNFDLLLEGAYGMAGFRLLDPRDDAAARERRRRLTPFPPTTFQEFRCVSCAPHFFQRGYADSNGVGADDDAAPSAARDQTRLASVLKIHGCVREYRERVHESETSKLTPLQKARRWSAYLSEIIFTFREIQNWRDDFWSQDLIRTLLRSRTMVFCGYSAADQVLHDTFRSVYEEMESANSRDQGAAAPGDADNNRRSERDKLLEPVTPAFFFDLQGVEGFYGAEIMSAASRAIGVRNPRRREHPNRIAFNALGTFPDLDDTMTWLMHKVIRKRQQQALETELGRAVTSMLGEPCGKSGLTAIRKDFQQLVQSEEDRMRGLSRTGHDAFDRVVSWTQYFHVGLLREFALAEVLLEDWRPGKKLGDLRRWPWYYPTSDHADWTAWSAVLELGIRRLAAHWRGDPTSWLGDSTYALNDEYPVVECRGQVRPRTPGHLRILLDGFNRTGYPPRPALPSRWHRDWALSINAIPWVAEDSFGTPGARNILAWASGRAPSDEDLECYLEQRLVESRGWARV